MGVERVAIVGTTGSGKSTLASELAALLGAEHVELDALSHAPGWTQVPAEQMRAGLRELANTPRWVVDGNYVDKTRDILWPRADLIVWLDMPIALVLWRLVRRSVGRIVRRTELWHGNRETWRMLFGSRSIVLWALRTHGRHRRELPPAFAEPAVRDVPVVRLRSRRAVAAWLAETGRDLAAAATHAP
jgi:adenylate kinase family enzyme